MKEPWLRERGGKKKEESGGREWLWKDRAVKDPVEGMGQRVGLRGESRREGTGIESGFRESRREGQTRETGRKVEKKERPEVRGLIEGASCGKREIWGRGPERGRERSGGRVGGR